MTVGNRGDDEEGSLEFTGLYTAVGSPAVIVFLKS